MKDNKMTIGIGAGGGYPNRIIKVNQSGTLTITGKSIEMVNCLEKQQQEHSK